MKITMLGTGSASTGRNRDNTSLLIQENENHIMIDVSGNPLGKLKRLNVNINNIKDVILTHFHIDHIYGLPSLLWGMWIGGRTENLTLHCSENNTEKLKKWLELMEIEKWPALFDIKINDYDWQKENRIIIGNKLTISTFPAIHGEPNTGLYIKYGKKVIVYSSDTEINNKIKEFKYIDILIHEATTAIKSTDSHTSLKEIIENYRINKIKKIYLVHLTDLEPYEQILDKLSLEKKQKFIISEDLMNIIV